MAQLTKESFLAGAKFFEKTTQKVYYFEAGNLHDVEGNYIDVLYFTEKSFVIIQQIITGYYGENGEDERSTTPRVKTVRTRYYFKEFQLTK